MTSRNIFKNVDMLERLNPLNKENWNFETKFLIQTIKPNSKVLQIGCTLGDRLVILWNNIRPIELWGVDIEEDLIKECERRLAKLGIKVRLFVEDVQKLPDFGTKFGYVICLNNTLGYIPNDRKAIEEMTKVVEGKLIISVYSDKFTDQIAEDYFGRLDNKIREIRNNIIYTNEVTVKRYSKKSVLNLFGDKVEFVETPLGFICIQNSN